jgi:hypothetical protein
MGNIHTTKKSMTTNHQITYHYKCATKIALDEVERVARKILREHKDLDEFVMGMGSSGFTFKNTDGLFNDSDFRYMEPVFNLINRWDNVLSLTGHPMRFTAEGKKITVW